jgi:uncharacterized membrane protein YecN with MAPEG domain
MTDFHAPAVTMLASGLLGLLFAVLSFQVVASRFSEKVSLGAGGEQITNPLYVAVRSHGNFAEYVPFALLLIGLIEVHTGPSWLVKGLAAALVLARLMHPVGMRMPAPNPFRAGGIIITLTVIAVSSVRVLLLTAANR